MKLKSFKEKDKKKIGIILFTITCILLITGVVLFRTFAIFEVNSNFNVINGTIEDPGDIYFAFYVKNEENEDYVIQKNMPRKEEGYVLDESRSYCGVTGKNDSEIKVFVTEDNMIHVSGVSTSRTKCNLYFTKGVYILGKGISLVSEGEDGLYEVKHEDVTDVNEGFKTTEYRYVGASPNNYIKFNDELWRIIGLVNVMTDENKVEQRVKIVRSDSIGKYSWDLKEDLTTSNKWKESSLSKLLNESYYNSQSNITYYNCTQYNFEQGKCVQKENKVIDFSTIGIKENSKNMIEKVYWDIGIEKFVSNNFQQLVIDERKGDSFQNNIGMIYPSDYYYTTSMKNSCLLNLDWKNQTDCYNNSWLSENKEESLWTISSNENSSISVYRLAHGEKSTDTYHSVVANASTFVNHVKPVVYLKPNVKILNEGQIGNETSPFQLVQILK